MVKRQYHAPRREAQARETRAAVIAAAHRRFLADGYAGTSLRQIATEAQVGEQTIYRIFGTKATLMRQVILAAVSGTEEETGDPAMEELMQALSTVETPLQAIALIGAWSAAIYERGGAELETVLFDAARVDPSLEDVAESIKAQRYRDTETLVRTVLGDAEPPPGMTASDIADYIYAVWSSPVYIQLVKERGWTIQQYIDFCVRMVDRMFLQALEQQK